MPASPPLVSTQNGPVRQIDAAAVRVTWRRAADFAVVTTFEVATAESRETRDLLPGKLAGLNEVMDAMMAVALGATRP